MNDQEHITSSHLLVFRYSQYLVTGNNHYMCAWAHSANALIAFQFTFAQQQI